MPRRNPELDHAGNPIPLYLQDVFAAGDSLEGTVQALTRTLNRFAKFEGRPGTEAISFPEIEAAVTYLRNLIDHWRPWMVCPSCPDRTRLNGKCVCEGRGWIPLAKIPGDALLKRERKRANTKAGLKGVPLALQSCKRWAKKAGLD